MLLEQERQLHMAVDEVVVVVVVYSLLLPLELVEAVPLAT